MTAERQSGCRLILKKRSRLLCRCYHSVRVVGVSIRERRAFMHVWSVRSPGQLTGPIARYDMILLISGWRHARLLFGRAP